MPKRRPEPEPESVPVVNVRAWVNLTGHVAMETDAGDLLLFDTPDRALETVAVLEQAARAAINGHEGTFHSADQPVPTAEQFEVIDASRRRWRRRRS